MTGLAIVPVQGTDKLAVDVFYKASVSSNADPDDYPAGVASTQTMMLPLGTRFWQRSLADATGSAISVIPSCDKADGPCNGDCMGDECCQWRPIELTRTQINLTARRVLLT